MSEPFLGEIRAFPYNFAPRNWASCDGQLLPISQNSGLFSLLGTTYGGNGVSNFALPDLRGRLPMHVGQGSGLTPRQLGESSGTESVTLLSSQIPNHTHALNASTGPGSLQSPANAYLATDATASVVNYSSGANTQMAGDAIGASGGSQPHDNMPPYLTFTFCIALQGVFPPRS
jgi:microcystin-dependent protein